MDIGTIIKEQRVKKEMTQEELAKEFFVSRPLISKWENGKSYPDLEQLLKLSDFFDLTLDELLKGDQLMTETIIKEDKKKKYLIRGLFALLIVLSLIIFNNYTNQVSIEYQKEQVSDSLDVKPFTKEEIKQVSIKDNIVTITFQSSLKNTYWGYFADGGNGEVTINLYKTTIYDDDAMKYDGTTQIDLTSMPKIKKLIIMVQ